MHALNEIFENFKCKIFIHVSIFQILSWIHSSLYIYTFIYLFVRLASFQQVIKSNLLSFLLKCTFKQNLVIKLYISNKFNFGFRIEIQILNSILIDIDIQILLYRFSWHTALLLFYLIRKPYVIHTSPL